MVCDKKNKSIDNIIILLTFLKKWAENKTLLGRTPIDLFTRITAYI